jgi:hypothetical protein
MIPLPKLGKNKLKKICKNSPWSERWSDEKDNRNPESNDFVITGEGVKEGFVHVKYEDGLVKTLDGKDYHVLHQWDRFSFAEDLRTRFK